MLYLRIILLKFLYFVSKNNSYNVTEFLSIKKFNSLEKLLGFTVYHPGCYLRALTHRSYLEVNESSDISNERLEFLGDAVVDLVVGKYLYSKFADKDEGFLTKTRSMLVNKGALFDASKRINLDDYLLVSENFAKTLPAGSKTVLSDAYEAIVGAIYLDKGLKKAEKFITNTLIEPSFEISGYLKDNNYKSQLLEYAQKNRLEDIDYSVIKEEGPQHQKLFTVEVKVNDHIFGIGIGKNKKSAEQLAAKNAIEKIKNS